MPHTPIALTALPPALANIHDGKLRALAVLAVKRNAEIVDVPTMREAGYPDQEAGTLTGVVAPTATPKEIIDLLQREIEKAVADPTVKQRLLKLGFEPVANKPEEFGARIKSGEVGQGRPRRTFAYRMTSSMTSTASAPNSSNAT
jgi:tripartite-type tricarboxylate transporter receptor subunit TctC